MWRIRRLTQQPTLGTIVVHHQLCAVVTDAAAAAAQRQCTTASAPSSSSAGTDPVAAADDASNSAAPTEGGGDRMQQAELRPNTWERLRHRVVRALTTSARSRAQMRDTANTRKYAQLERTKVQWVNDVFMAEGKSGRDTVDDRTLEKGLTWSFMLPFCGMLWVFLVVFLWFARAHRDERLREQAAALEALLVANKAHLDAQAEAHAAFLKTLVPESNDG